MCISPVIGGCWFIFSKTRFKLECPLYFNATKEGGSLLRNTEVLIHLKSEQQSVHFWCCVFIMFTALDNTLWIPLPPWFAGLQGELGWDKFCFILSALGVATNHSTTGAEKCISARTLLITSNFRTHCQSQSRYARARVHCSENATKTVSCCWQSCQLASC